MDTWQFLATRALSDAYHGMILVLAQVESTGENPFPPFLSLFDSTRFRHLRPSLLSCMRRKRLPLFRPTSSTMALSCSLRRLALACLVLAPGIAQAIIDRNHTAAMARQVRFHRTGKLAKRQDEGDDDYVCTATKGCDIGCCGPL